MRQIEIAELMASANNYSKGYAEALLLGTPKDILVDPGAPRVRTRISREELARIRKLLANSKIERFLGKRHAEMLVEFERIAASEGV